MAGTTDALGDLDGVLREWDFRLALMRGRCLDLSDVEAARCQPYLHGLAIKVETLRSRWNDRGLAPILPPEIVARILEAERDLEASYAAAVRSLGPLVPGDA